MIGRKGRRNCERYMGREKGRIRREIGQFGAREEGMKVRYEYEGENSKSKRERIGGNTERTS